MRIAFFSPHSDPLAAPGQPDSGGQCVYERMVAETLAKAGHEVRIYTRRWGGGIPSEQIHPRAIVRRFPMGPDGFLRKENMLPFIQEFTQEIISNERLWLSSADILHGHYWDGGVCAMLISGVLGIPMLFTSHSLGLLKKNKEPDHCLSGNQLRYAERIDTEKRVVGSAQALIALSSLERQMLIHRYGAYPGNTFVVPGGVDPQHFKPCSNRKQIRSRLGVSADLLVFAAGRLDRRKGFLELTECFPYVIDGVERHDRKVTFILPACTNQSSENEHRYHRLILEKITHHGITNYVRWVPWLKEELADYYAVADVFVCPSLYEPFGLMVIEALATGTPVVATIHGGPREIIRNGIDGFTADPLDGKAFADNILRVLLASDEDRSYMGVAARKRCIERYAWPIICEEIMSVYQRIIRPGAIEPIQESANRRSVRT